MIQIHDITNSIFTSKTYILYKDGECKAWLVDIGDVEPVISFMDSKGLSVEGIFLTHAHFDHIYGLEAVVYRYPECKVYCTEFCKEALASEKLNMSRYHGTPINYRKENVVVVHDGESFQLFEDEPMMVFYETPGHNPGCLSMVMRDVIFTGDAYIPGAKIVTNLPGGNKRTAQESLSKILKYAQGKTICPGHHINEENAK